MSRLDAAISRFWEHNQHWISAVLAVAGALVAASLLDRALARRGHAIAQAVAGGELSPGADTRLRFVRRLASAVIVALGLAVAASQFAGINRIAASVLASGAIAAAVVGFAARQTLANLVAGVMLAITQPLRVGDWIGFEDHDGQVEDIRLNYTILRTPGDRRVVIPNERLASGIMRNDTLGGAPIGLDVHLWLPPGADAARAVAALEAETRHPVSVTESTAEGLRLSVGGAACAPPDRAAREAELRLRCLMRLRAEGLLEPAG